MRQSVCSWSVHKENFPNSTKDIVFANGRIKSGTIDAIINYFIQQQDQIPKVYSPLCTEKNISKY
jgi:hypothetical protein